MPKWTFNQASTKKELKRFFKQRQTDLRTFGSTVNQTFEAFVFASVVQWYKERDWQVGFVNPIDPKTKRPRFQLKYNTRGAPKKYTFAVATKGKKSVHIRHNLRVATKAHRRNKKKFYANMCLDVSVIRSTDLSYYKTYYALPNQRLITFGEAKHMPAFAELVASFIGILHEVQPRRLKRPRHSSRRLHHLPPFLFVSGLLQPTARGLEYTCKRRRFDFDIYSSAKEISLAFAK
jgi:hypothetical protein